MTVNVMLFYSVLIKTSAFSVNPFSAKFDVKGNILLMLVFKHGVLHGCISFKGIIYFFLTCVKVVDRIIVCLAVIHWLLM